MTIQTATAAVQSLPDALVSTAVEELFQNVFDNVPPDQMVGVVELDRIRQADVDTLEKPLPSDEALYLGRALLEGYAADETLHILAEQACKNVIEKAGREASLTIGSLLAVGVVVNLTYLIMSTEVIVQQGKDGVRTWSVRKRADRPEFVKSIIEKFALFFR